MTCIYHIGTIVYRNNLIEIRANLLKKLILAKYRTRQIKHVYSITARTCICVCFKASYHFLQLMFMASRQPYSRQPATHSWTRHISDLYTILETQRRGSR